MIGSFWKVLRKLLDRPTAAADAAEPVAPPISLFIEEMAEALRTGPVTDKSFTGVRELETKFVGRLLEISWYAGSRRLRSLSFDGTAYFCTGPEVQYLLAAAMERVEKLFVEKVAELEALRQKHTKTPRMRMHGPY